MDSIQELLDEFGVESCEDLQEIYVDDILIKKIESKLRPIEFSRFKRAARETKLLEGMPLSSLITAGSTPTKSSTSKFSDEVIYSDNWMLIFVLNCTLIRS